jgi:hypothetical protein
MSILVDDEREKVGGRTFANKTFANRTFANGESPGVYWRKYSGLSPIGEFPEDVLAKVQETFANWRNSRVYVGESKVDFASFHETILI